MIALPNYCPECGSEQISLNAEICPNCGVRFKKKPEKSSGIAALCSFVFVGLGQVYNGDGGRGFLLYIGALIGSLFFFIPGLIVWIYGIYDAYTTAKRMNAEEIPYKETNVLHMILFLFFWFIGIFVFIFLTVIMGAFLSAFLFSMT